MNELIAILHVHDEGRVQYERRKDRVGNGGNECKGYLFFVTPEAVVAAHW
jgi:hypothetical protein